ncbi:class I SAM-dependent methyltransferase [Actinocrispum wychmicini]|uniref:Methyltransferase family protein n=1 Tax=Actinocrispum wychmicini TaxID=1213861 RepID=A0A4R2JSP9_9PSEU|nr:class I SAM-dependent methyltransferase [Actinocrispum wychmicini]TCO59909.1 methyltransferase family protein [Actinocrispum wychmicini]
MAGQYGKLWDSFWKDLPGRPGEAFWDCSATLGAATHVELFKPHFDPGLPLVDLGCGNGTQTRYLAGLFERVIGADISVAALDRARAENAADNIEYLPLDVLDAERVRAFHDRFGDVNVYLSGVIHQLSTEDRMTCVRSLAVLAGDLGGVFDQELTPASYTYMQRLINESSEDLRKLDRVSTYFRIGLQPSAGEAQLETVFAAAGFTILDAGDLMLHTTETLADGTPLDLPTHYVVAVPSRS